MVLFLLSFLTLYGAINFYFFWKVRLVWPHSIVLLVAVGAWCAFMIAAPILVRVFEREGHLGAARVCAFTGHTWMALVFWFLCLGALAELWNLAVRVAGHYQPGVVSLRLTPGLLLVGCGGIIALIAAWGVFAASNIRLKEVRFTTPKLAAGTPPLRIAQISDVHLSLTLREGRLWKMLDLVRRARPDILVSTGDMVDLSYAERASLEALLAEVRPPLGKFAILGNHEFYAGLRYSIPFLEHAGFRVLRSESAQVAGVTLVGVDDPAGAGMRESNAAEIAALESAGDSRPTILLKHRPLVNEGTLGRFDLQISGHTHGGQIFPFHVLTRLFHPVPPGMNRVGKDSWLYLSRGAGTWGPQMRFLAPPEVTVFVIEPGEAP